jgi:uncharacterized membrane protein
VGIKDKRDNKMSTEEILKEVFQKKEITKEDIEEALKEMKKARAVYYQLVEEETIM